MKTHTELKNYRFSPYTVLVSRVKRVIENPEKISPISCTMVSVEDTYFDVEGDYSFYETITGSRVYATKVLKGNAGVNIDLSKIRSKGTIGSNGLVAQGVSNFMAMYSAINAEVRRGNGFKNGAVVLSLDYEHLDLKDFLEFGSNGELPWAKKSITIDRQLFTDAYSSQLGLILAALDRGDIFLVKKQYNQQNIRLFNNVCLAIHLKSRSTCTLAPLNLGMIKNLDDIPSAMTDVYDDLNEIWEYFNETYADHFADPILDKQIGLGLVGLGNLLANHNLTYQELADAFDALDGKLPVALINKKAWSLVGYLHRGYRMVAEQAREDGYDRVFTVEPTASCSYANQDFNGYTLSPEISPVVCHPETKIARRQSQDSYEEYQYPPNIQVAGVDVSADVYFRVACGFQRLMDSTDLAHGLSYNWWLTQPVNHETLQQWFNSPLKNVYYKWSVESQAQDKTNIGEQLNDDEEFWGGIACECGS